MMFFFSFIAGMVVGLLIDIFILVALIYLKFPIEQRMTIIKNSLPQQKLKGSIIEPESELEEEQKEIIRQNRAKGHATYLSEITPN